MLKAKAAINAITPKPVITAPYCMVVDIHESSTSRVIDMSAEVRAEPSALESTRTSLDFMSSADTERRFTPFHSERQWSDDVSGAVTISGSSVVPGFGLVVSSDVLDGAVGDGLADADASVEGDGLAEGEASLVSSSAASAVVPVWVEMASVLHVSKLSIVVYSRPSKNASTSEARAVLAVSSPSPLTLTLPSPMNSSMYGSTTTYAVSRSAEGFTSVDTRLLSDHRPKLKTDTPAMSVIEAKAVAMYPLTFVEAIYINPNLLEYLTPCRTTLSRLKL